MGKRGVAAVVKEVTRREMEKKMMRLEKLGAIVERLPHRPQLLSLNAQTIYWT